MITVKFVPNDEKVVPLDDGRWTYVPDTTNFGRGASELGGAKGPLKRVVESVFDTQSYWMHLHHSNPLAHSMVNYEQLLQLRAVRSNYVPRGAVTSFSAMVGQALGSSLSIATRCVTVGPTTTFTTTFTSSLPTSSPSADMVCVAAQRTCNHLCRCDWIHRHC